MTEISLLADQRGILGGNRGLWNSPVTGVTVELISHVLYRATGFCSEPMLVAGWEPFMFESESSSEMASFAMAKVISVDRVSWTVDLGDSLEVFRGIDYESARRSLVSSLWDAYRYDGKRSVPGRLSVAVDGEQMGISLPCLEALGINPGDPVTKDSLRKAFGEKMLVAHPDHGGDAERVQWLMRAYEEAKRRFVR